MKTPAEAEKGKIFFLKRGARFSLWKTPLRFTCDGPEVLAFTIGPRERLLSDFEEFVPGDVQIDGYFTMEVRSTQLRR